MLTQIINEESYKILQTQNQPLLAAIASAIDQGGTAKEIERRLRQKYGQGNTILDVAIGTAYHYESQQQPP